MSNERKDQRGFLDRIIAAKEREKKKKREISLYYYPICSNCKVRTFVYKAGKNLYQCLFCGAEFEGKRTKREERDYYINKRIVLTYFIRKYLKDFGMNPYFKNQFEDFVNGVNKEIRKLLKKGVIRAKANNRKTLMEYDL